MANDSSGHRQITDLSVRRSRMLGPIQAVRRLSASTGSARAVLNVLASYADADTFEVWVGRTTLSTQSGQSRSTLRRAIRRLEESGELVTLEVGAGERPSRYRITLSTPVGEPVDNSTVPARERVHSEPGEGSPRTRGRVHGEPQPRGLPRNTERGARSRTCERHAGVDNPPPCVPCRDARLAADAADENEAALLLAARRCDHGRLDGSKVVGAGEHASRLCPDCEREDPASP